jgi:hypothetical protein
MKLIRIGGLALLVAAVSLGAWAATKTWAAHCGGATGLSCTENVRATKHNLAANTDIVSTGTGEVCVFCHTPHGGRTDVAGGGAPLWNRALPSGAGYQTYTSPNFDNDQNGGTDNGPKGVSLACLSCHDGTIALDALINAPGSGGFVVGNKDGTNITSNPNIGFSGGGVDSTESMREGSRPPSTGVDPYLRLNNFVSDGSSSFGMEPFPNLTQDLRDDHPISMRMPVADPQFTDALNNSTQPRPTSGRSSEPAQFCRPTNAIRSGFTTPRRRWTGWSASCHNPHTPRTTFLRLPSIAGAEAGRLACLFQQRATPTLNH